MPNTIAVIFKMLNSKMFPWIHCYVEHIYTNTISPIHDHDQDLPHHHYNAEFQGVCGPTADLPLPACTQQLDWEVAFLTTWNMSSYHDIRCKKPIIFIHTKYLTFCFKNIAITLGVIHCMSSKVHDSHDYCFLSKNDYNFRWNWLLSLVKRPPMCQRWQKVKELKTKTKSKLRRRMPCPMCSATLWPTMCLPGTGNWRGYLCPILFQNRRTLRF